MVTHQEIDKLNKEPLKQLTHELLDHKIDCADRTRRIRIVSFWTGVGAVLLGWLIFRVIASVGIANIIQALFWIMFAALALYGAVKLWSERQLGDKFKTVSDRLAVYGNDKKQESSGSAHKKKPKPMTRLRRKLAETQSTQEVRSK